MQLARFHPVHVRSRGAATSHRQRTVACKFARSGVPHGQLMEMLKSEAAFAEQLSSLPNYDFILDMHMSLHDMVAQRHPLQLAPTKVSNEQGTFLKHATGPPFASAVLRVQSLTGPAPIDWVHHTSAIAPGFAYTKSSVFTADDCLTPHLELEMGASGDGSKLLLYLNMDPRLSLTMYPRYLEHYYTTTPPGASSSWWELEAKAAALPVFTRYTSASLHVRQCSASAILFNFKGDAEGRAAAKGVLSEAVAIWLAWLQGGTNSATSVEAVAAAAGQEAVPADAAAQQQLLTELAARSAAWRNFPRREKEAAMMRAAFGDQAIEDYWDSMAGAARLRL